MADETEKPKRRRRRTKASEEGSASSARGSSGADRETTASDPSASESDPSSEVAPTEIEPTADDIRAEEQASDVVLEAAAEIDEDSGDEAPEPEAEKPKPRRRRKPAAEAQAEEPAPPPRPAPARRRPPRDPSLPPPVVRAHAKYVRSSARKARLVCDHIRGKSVEEARAILAHAPRAVARDWSKLLESAVANAENNHELVSEDLYVKAVHADEGPTIKRFRPRAMGRATRIRKRTSHLTILLTPRE